MRSISRTTAAWAVLVALAIVVTISLSASAVSPPFERQGTDYDGKIPRDCPVFEEQDDGDLLISCTSSKERSDRTRVRYRFTKDYGIKRGPATIDYDITILEGPSDCVRVRWMGDHPVEPTRTIRVSVVNTRPRCLAEVHSVTLVSQP